MDPLSGLQSMNALEISDLVKSYAGGPRVLDGVTLSLQEGTITALLGLNGSGKTTTLRATLGLTSLERGTIAVLGKRIDPFSPQHKQHIGAVLDEPLYFDWLSGRESIRLHARMRGLPERIAAERTAELLEFLNLADVQHEPIKTYSTGMKKKVSLATAIIHRPPILILDEPFEGIDPLAADDILQTLQLMASQGTGILVTSHIFETVERLCSRVEILHNGKIELSCPTSEIMARATGTGEAGGLAGVFFELVSPGRQHRPPRFLT